jgi:hypothetical protein
MSASQTVFESIEFMNSASLEQLVEYFSERSFKSTSNFRGYDKLKPLDKILATMASASIANMSPGGNSHMEWNPISQRAVLRKPQTFTGALLTSDFQHLFNQVHDFIEFAHEMMHVVLWEPLFAGKWRFRTASEFTTHALLSEAFCFFYGDMVIARKIRDTYPDGEVVFSRNAVSLPYFPPYRVFQALGKTDPSEILGVYMNAFLAQERPGSGEAENITNEFLARIHDFHKGAMLALGKVHAIFNFIGLFDEFFERFCEKKGIPQLLSDEILKTSFEGNGQFFFTSFFNEGLAEIEKADSGLLERVRLRRSIQTRAYYALQLKALISTGRYFSGNGQNLDPATLTCLEKYLSQLENTLSELCENQTISVVSENLESADRFYESNVRTHLKSADVWTTERIFVMPLENITKIGVNEQSLQQLSGKKLYDNVTFLIQKMILRQLGPISGDEHRQLLVATSSLTELARDDGSELKPSIASKYKDLLMSPGIRRYWSAPLFAIGPLEDSFREILFYYE